MTYKVAAFYRFTPLNDIPGLRARIRAEGERLDICGTILLAPEGVNSTIAAAPDALDEFMTWLDKTLGISRGEVKYSTAQDKPFNRFKVRPKKEIITMRVADADPNALVGEYVSPEEWNALVERDDVTLIDTRNTYETAVGTFRGAIDPGLESFTDFADYVERELDPATHKHVAMYCTGGIRCEKASSYMLARGFENVYHLKGGILKYLEDIPEQESLWDGECFVFDKRVAVTHGLAEGSHAICYGCRAPLAPADRQSGSYEEGVSCPHCIDDLTQERAQALRQRHRQFQDA